MRRGASEVHGIFVLRGQTCRCRRNNNAGVFYIIYVYSICRIDDEWKEIIDRLKNFEEDLN
jgi:hypothetical protein